MKEALLICIKCNVLIGCTTSKVNFCRKCDREPTCQKGNMYRNKCKTFYCNKCSNKGELTNAKS